MDQLTPGFIGLIEGISAKKRPNGQWRIWITSRTGPNGIDTHGFDVPHAMLGEWFVEMFKAEDSKNDPGAKTNS